MQRNAQICAEGEGAGLFSWPRSVMHQPDPNGFFLIGAKLRTHAWCVTSVRSFSSIGQKARLSIMLSTVIFIFVYEDRKKKSVQALLLQAGRQGPASCAQREWCIGSLEAFSALYYCASHYCYLWSWYRLQPPPLPPPSIFTLWRLVMLGLPDTTHQRGFNPEGGLQRWLVWIVMKQFMLSFM